RWSWWWRERVGPGWEDWGASWWGWGSSRSFARSRPCPSPPRREPSSLVCCFRPAWGCSSAFIPQCGRRGWTPSRPCARKSSGGETMAQDYRENVILAMDTLRAHKLRSFLTVLGVVMGVAVLMLVAALLSGFDQNVTSAITAYRVD